MPAESFPALDGRNQIPPDGQGLLAQIGPIKQIHQHIVSIMLEPRIEVYQGQRITNNGEQPKDLRGWGRSAKPSRERGKTSENHIHVHAGQVHRDAGPSPSQPHIGGVHEDDRGKPMPPSTDPLNLSAECLCGEAMSELMQRHGDGKQRQQTQQSVSLRNIVYRDPRRIAGS